MFNTPRPAQTYSSNSANNFGASFVVDNPLSNSIYDSDGLDPWSSAPSPAPPPLPSSSTAGTGSSFTSVIGMQSRTIHESLHIYSLWPGEATVPSIYHEAFATVDTANIGETSVNALSRVLETSALSATTVDKARENSVVQIAEAHRLRADRQPCKLQTSRVQRRVLCGTSSCCTRSKWKRCVV